MLGFLCKAADANSKETSWDFVSRSCRGVLFQSWWEGEEILWILPVWAQGSQAELGGLVWESCSSFMKHTEDTTSAGAHTSTTRWTQIIETPHDVLGS